MRRQLCNVSCKRLPFSLKIIIHHLLIFAILLLLHRSSHSTSFSTIICTPLTPHSYACEMFIFQVSGVFQNLLPNLSFKQSQNSTARKRCSVIFLKKTARYFQSIFLMSGKQSTTHKMQSPKILMGQSKEFKQNWTGLKNFYICFCIFLVVMTKLFFLERTMGTRLTSI